MCRVVGGMLYLQRACLLRGVNRLMRGNPSARSTDHGLRDSFRLWNISCYTLNYQELMRIVWREERHTEAATQAVRGVGTVPSTP